MVYTCGIKKCFYSCFEAPTGLFSLNREVEGGLGICTEKYNDKLELMFGEQELLWSYARRYRATGDLRKPSYQHCYCKATCSRFIRAMLKMLRP